MQLKLWCKKKRKQISAAIIAIVIGTAFAAGVANQTSNVSLEALNKKYEKAIEIKAKYVLDNASLVKTDIKNPKLDKYTGEFKDEIKITIGDKDKTEFVPNIELKRWSEVSFKIKTDNLLAGVETKDKDLKFDKNKIIFKTPKMDFEMYDYTEGEGGFKYIWILNEKPKTNTISFGIEVSNLDFFFQPPLNEENTDPNLTCTETQCLDLEGNIVMERPIEIVGSYQVYHSAKGGLVDAWGKAYGTGKAFSISRPKIIDNNENWVWGELFIDADAGIYRITIPQSFIDTAQYPIRSE